MPRSNLFLACSLLKQVNTAFPIGFLSIVDNCIIPLVIALEIKSKFAVSPLTMHPIAIKPSYFFTSLDIVTGISKEPGTLITSGFLKPDLANSFFAEVQSSLVISFYMFQDIFQGNF